MKELEIKGLRAHAGKLVADGKPLSGVFEYCIGGTWFKWDSNDGHDYVPDFADGDEWQIAQPKKQLIDLLHPYFKGCAVSIETFGNTKQFEFMSVNDLGQAHLVQAHPQAGFFPDKSALRLATPADEDSNWQYFRSTPENDAKLRELAKMVNVEVRYFDALTGGYGVCGLNKLAFEYWYLISNFRITGECQDGWTDNPEDAKP